MAPATKLPGMGEEEGTNWSFPFRVSARLIVLLLVLVGPSLFVLFSVMVPRFPSSKSSMPATSLTPAFSETKRKEGKNVRND